MDIIRYFIENKIGQIDPESKILSDLLENVYTGQFEEVKFDSTLIF